MPATEMRGSAGIAFLLGAEVTMAVIAKDCSSPQTAEINADSRAKTLIKWVNVGVVEAGFVIVLAAFIDPSMAKYFILGGVIEGAITYVEYLHAKQAGLASCEEGTES